MRRCARLGVSTCVAVAVGLIMAAGASAASAAMPAFSAHGSVEQVYVTGLHPRARMKLLNHGQATATKRADGLGGLLFRHVRPGGGYRVRLAGGGAKSGRLRVLSRRPAPPNKDVYKQQIPSSGYGYLKTRDGTKLAIDVHPPQDVTNVLPGVQLPPIPAGPTPTLIEYSVCAWILSKPKSHVISAMKHLY